MSESETTSETTGYFRIPKDAIERIRHPKNGGAMQSGKAGEWIWRGLSVLISLVLAPTAAWVWTSEARIAKLEIEIETAIGDLESLQEWSHDWEQTISTRPSAVSQENRPQIALIQKELEHLSDKIDQKNRE